MLSRRLPSTLVWWPMFYKQTPPRMINGCAKPLEAQKKQNIVLLTRSNVVKFGSIIETLKPSRRKLRRSRIQFEGKKKTTINSLIAIAKMELLKGTNLQNNRAE